MVVIAMRVKYTKEILEPIVLESISMAGVIKKLGMRFSGGLHGHLTSRIKFFEISTSHFTRRGCNKGKFPYNKRKWEDVLINRKSGIREDSKRLRESLIKSGREYKCQECGIGPIWNNKTLCIQVDHKDGNWLNNSPENLQFLCPNCHTQTKNFGVKNIISAGVA